MDESIEVPTAADHARAALARRDRRRKVRSEFAQRRTFGLAARHAAKLARGSPPQAEPPAARQ